MAQLVLVAAGTVREQQELDDLISVHDDDVDLTGSGYANFRIVQVKGIKAAVIRLLLELGSTRVNADSKHKFNFKTMSNRDFQHIISGTDEERITALKKVERRR